MSRFNTNACAIPDVWCGNGNTTYHVVSLSANGIPKVYTRNGTKVECLRKGVGAGKASHHRGIASITYVSDAHVRAMANRGVKTLAQLRSTLEHMTGQQKASWLKGVLDIGKGVNWKAYNAILLYLNKNGVDNLPRCKKLV